MKCIAKRGVACLPVTALHTIECGSTTILLSSEGSALSIRFAPLYEVVFCCSIFESQNVHGITSSILQRYDGQNAFSIIIWGGPRVCICKLLVKDDTPQNAALFEKFETIRSLTFDDWVMTVVCGRNRAQALLLTAHNALWMLDITKDIKNPLICLTQGVKTLLYSASITQVTDYHIVVASGTVFGEVIVWTCSKSSDIMPWNSGTKHLFLGHQGSIFGVSISEQVDLAGKQYRLLASCSDDRTIRIWDITDCDQDGTISGGLNLAAEETGFGNQYDKDLQLASAWGHLSRIWGVYFLPVSLSTNGSLSLVSRGEDGACQFWHLRPSDSTDGNQASPYILSATKNDRYHAGKNTWSHAVSSRPEHTQMFTGGADGQIVERDVCTWSSVSPTSIVFEELARNWDTDLGNSLRQYLLCPNGTIIATTDTGNVVKASDTDLTNWDCIFKCSRKSTTILCNNAVDDLAFYCLSDGSLLAYDSSSGAQLDLNFTLPAQACWLQIAGSRIRDDGTCTLHLVANLYGNKHPTLITVIQKGRHIQSSGRKLHLPTDFVVTCSFYNQLQDVLVCGSRSGAVAVFPSVGYQRETLDRFRIFRHIHKSDAITSIIDLRRELGFQTEESIHILTTGRDGFFAVHHVKLGQFQPELQTVHMADLPFGPNVEGAYILEVGSAAPTLFLYGFKSKNFILWNETQQLQVLSIDCGGAHRSWNFATGHGGSGTFVWTKAGTLNLIHESHRSNTIQQGSHGREIKALALSARNLVKDTDSSCGNTTVLMATGAEDTDIRLARYATSEFCQVAVLRHHTTGLQALQFSRLNEYLFSSGGVGEFAVWKLEEIPVIDIGARVLCSMPKDREDDDARILSFDVVEQNSHDPESKVFLAMVAFSYGKVKVFEFVHHIGNDSAHFNLIQQIDIGPRCLSQAQFLVSGASCDLLFGATDGFLRFSSLASSKDLTISHRVHQSNVSAMAVQEICPDIFLVATGGDDNALGLSIVQNMNEGVIFRTVLIPKAHAAALTAVTIIDASSWSGGRAYFVVSVGNDQMVCLWRVGLTHPNSPTDMQLEVQNKQMPLSELQVEQLCAYPTDVADVSNVGLVGIKSQAVGKMNMEVLVVGVGMQSICFNAEY